MPIYEYRCEQGHTFEVMQRMTDDPLVSCQTCDAPVERVFHPVAVHFKGSGFYTTDYGSRRRGGDKEEGTSGSESKGESGSDSKGESGSDSKGESSSTKADKAKSESAKTGSAKSD